MTLEQRKQLSEAHKGQIPSNLKQLVDYARTHRGTLSPRWKGGLPKCSDCNVQLASYRAKRCKSHAWIKNTQEEHWAGKSQ